MSEHNKSRRLFLVAGTATALAATLKRAAAASTTSSDAELFALGEQVAFTDETLDKVCAAHEAAEDVFRAATPPAPIPPKVDISNEDWFKALQAKMAAIKDKPPSPQQTAYEAAVKEHEQLCDRIKLDCGFDTAEQTLNDANEAVSSLRERIVEIRATTLAGLILKAKYAANHYEEDYDPLVMTSIVDDLLALDGEA
jgi:hypothetical protein